MGGGINQRTRARNRTLCERCSLTSPAKREAEAAQKKELASTATASDQVRSHVLAPYQMV